MNLIPDPLEKTVKIPVVFKSGKFLLLDSRELPEIKDGSVGCLELNEYAVLDKESVQELQAEADIQMIPSDKSVYFAVSFNMVPNNLRNSLLSPDELNIVSNYGFIKVILHEPLMLHLRGSKMPQLLDCECIIPSLRNLKARSMNHAYTLISRHYEKKRRSHSGNVFQKGYYHNGIKWFSFDDLRIQCQSKECNKNVT